MALEYDTKIIIGFNKYYFETKDDNTKLYINGELKYDIQSDFFPTNITIENQNSFYCWFCTQVLKIENNKVVMDYIEDNQVSAIYILKNNLVLIVTELSIMWRSTIDWSKEFEYDYNEVILKHKILNENEVLCEDFYQKKFIVKKGQNIINLD
ncbi:hypothetical protein N5853_06230 [Bartonella sp. HY329]|uniref:hypothetical protein n=1 Tax=unclassified Bartonella TaxID=2645622 RepID=UPI0021C9E4EA|nr:MULTISPECIES: hypothetical protein [unclassified Bartonella]UXM96204.1 hypothetical protein N5853_06230 [Bartonella sp. HY329]UXN10528.1 hypothetical protein N5852_06240 [Bartonella sp. HY328]